MTSLQITVTARCLKFVMITLDSGIKIRGLGLWLDATRSRPLSFVSHAHQDHVARHQQAIMSPTANLLQKRDAGIKKSTGSTFTSRCSSTGYGSSCFRQVTSLAPLRFAQIHEFLELAATLSRKGFSATHLENNMQLSLWDD